MWESLWAPMLISHGSLVIWIAPHPGYEVSPENHMASRGMGMGLCWQPCCMALEALRLTLLGKRDRSQLDEGLQVWKNHQE